MQTVTITGLGATAVDARLAFRYFVTNGVPCGSNSNYIGIDTLSVDQTLSIDEFTSNSFKHFYNSESDVLTLDSSTNAFINVEIYNILGQSVLSKTLTLTTENINLSTFKDGVYLVKAAINNQAKTFKLLKQ